jgi:hypothetical protein
MGSDLPGMDRREAYRPRFFAEVEIERGETRMTVRTQDISLEGMLLETDEPLEPGAEFKARVRLERGPALEAECVVKRLVPGIGMGVEFLEMTAGDRVRLRKLVEELPH